MNSQKIMGIGLLIMGLIVELIVISFSASGLEKLFPVEMVVFGVSVIVIAAYVVETSKLALVATLVIDKAKGLGMSKVGRLFIALLSLAMIVVTAAGTWSYFKETNNSHYQKVDDAGLEIEKLTKQSANLETVKVTIDEEIVKLEETNEKADDRMDSRIKPLEDKVTKITDSIDTAYEARDEAISEGAASIDRRIEQARAAQKETNKLVQAAEKRVLHFIVKAQKKVNAIEVQMEQVNLKLQEALGVGSLSDPRPIEKDMARLERRLEKAERKLETLEEDKEDNIEEATSDLKAELKGLSRSVRKLQMSKENLNETVASSDKRIKRLNAKLIRAEGILEDKRDELESEVAELLSDNRDRMSDIQKEQRAATVTIAENAKEITELEVFKATTFSQVGPAKSIASMLDIDGRTAGSILSLFYTIPLVIFGYFMVSFGMKMVYRKPATA